MSLKECRHLPGNKKSFGNVADEDGRGAGRSSRYRLGRHWSTEICVFFFWCTNLLILQHRGTLYNEKKWTKLERSETNKQETLNPIMNRMHL